MSVSLTLSLLDSALLICGVLMMAAGVVLLVCACIDLDRMGGRDD